MSNSAQRANSQKARLVRPARADPTGTAAAPCSRFIGAATSNPLKPTPYLLGEMLAAGSSPAPPHLGRTSPRSFEIQSRQATDIVDRALRLGAAQGPGLGFIFLTETLSQQGPQIARGLAERGTKGGWLIASARGVFTERGEDKGDAVAAGMWIPGLRARFIGGRQSESAWGVELAATLSKLPRASTLVFSNDAPGNAGWSIDLGHLTPRSRSVMGAGTLPDAPVHWFDGSVHSASAVAVVLEGAASPHVVSSSACRLLTPLTAVTRARGSMVLELDDSPALAVLSECTASLEEQPLILLAIADGERPLAAAGRNLSLQAIEGVDPSIGGILMGEALSLGTRVHFAVRDRHASRADLRAHLNTLRRNTAGAAPSFGLYFDCAGRGPDLYGIPDVDLRLISEQFPQMPLLGLRSTYQMTLRKGRLSSQIYSGLLGVFCSPS